MPGAADQPAITPLDQIEYTAMAEIPAIPVDDSVPPFPVDQPVRYFRNWLKQTFRAGLRRLRLSG